MDSGCLTGNFFYRVNPAGEEGKGIVLTRVSTGKKTNVYTVNRFCFRYFWLFFLNISGNPAILTLKRYTGMNGIPMGTLGVNHS